MCTNIFFKEKTFSAFQSSINQENHPEDNTYSGCNEINRIRNQCILILILFLMF